MSNKQPLVAQECRPSATPTAAHNIALGAAFMVGAALCFALAPAMARSVSEGMHVMTMVFWSNLWMLIFICTWAAFQGQGADLRTKRIGLHLFRSILTYSAIVAYFFAVTLIPFANAVILQSMGPLFVPILAFFLLRRIADRFVWWGVLVSFVGVTLIVRPEGLSISLGETFALLSALVGAASTLVISSLSRTEPAARQMFYFALFALVLSAMTLPWFWQVPTLFEAMQIGFVALFTLVGQFLYSKALSVAPPEKVNTWIYMSLVFAAAIGFFLWNEPVQALTVAGAALVVVGATLATRENRTSSPQS